jgi:hypothetical protein
MSSKADSFAGLSQGAKLMHSKAPLMAVEYAVDPVYETWHHRLKLAVKKGTPHPTPEHLNLHLLQL